MVLLLQGARFNCAAFRLVVMGLWRVAPSKPGEGEEAGRGWRRPLSKGSVPSCPFQQQQHFILLLPSHRPSP
jgi:hypothetical protein